jgi:drug/metabolite transporter (DMT)-like permease
VDKKATAHAGLLATNLFFAINLSAVKFLTDNKYLQPFGLNVIRVGLSVILFWLLFLLKPSARKMERTDLPRFIWCAVTGVAINQLLFLKGLSLTYSIHAVLLMLTTPILITVFAAWLLKEKFSINKMAGLGLGIIGALILITSRRDSGTGQNVLLGDVLIFINAISYSIYFILVKPLMIKYHPIQVTRWIFTLGFPLVLLFGLNEFNAIQWLDFRPAAWVCLGLIVIGGTFLAYLFNVYGIKVLGASVAGAYIYIQPFFAAFIAMIFLNEKLDNYKILAAILIFCGVYFSNKSTVKKQEVNK